MLGGVTTVAVIALLAPGLFVWGQFITPPEGAMEVEAVGAQWSWSFRLPGEDKQFGSTDVRNIAGEQPSGRQPGRPAGA